MEFRESYVSVQPSTPRYPYSLFVVIALVTANWLTLFVPSLFPPVVRIATTIPLLCFAPGYAVLAALSPERRSDSRAGRFYGLDTIERVTYSVIFSLIIVPFVGLAWNFTPEGIQLFPVATTIGLVTLGAAIAAVYRWNSLPPAERFSLGVRRHTHLVWNELFAVRSSTDYLLNVIFVLAILVAAGGVVYGAASPGATGANDSGHSELFLATEDENGSLALGNYPTAFENGESKQLVLGIENKEGAQQQYAVAVFLERVEGDSVIESRLLNQYDATVPDGSRWTKTTSVQPTMAGDNLRLTYRVYLGEVPSDLETAEPDYEVYLYIDVAPRNSDVDAE